MPPKDQTTQHYQGLLSNGDAVEVAVHDGRIASVEPIAPADGLPEFLPVLVELQHNGSLGVSYNDLHTRSIDDLHSVAKHLRAHGVGRCLATLTTFPLDELHKSASVLDKWLNNNESLDSLFFGIFHEGIYISPEDGWRGAHAMEWIAEPDWEAFCATDTAAGSRIKMVNIAPELPGGMNFIKQAVAGGKLVTLGHANPDSATVREAVACGASLVTHLGNGAPPTIHRFDNPLWSYLDESKLRAGVVCDGFHLPPELVGCVKRCKNSNSWYAVSDASTFAGCSPGGYTRPNGQGFTIEPDGHIHLNDSQVMVGAWFQLDRGVEFLVQNLGMSLREAWRQCSEVPAEIIGIKLPTVAVGQPADFVLARWADGLVINQAVHNGVPVLSGPIRPQDDAEVSQKCMI